MLYEDRVARFRWSVPETFNFASDVIDLWAEDRGRTALYAEDERGRETRYTFRDVAVRSHRLANALQGLGVRRGDPVLVVFPPVPEWTVAVLGVLRLGGLVVCVPPSLRAGDLVFRAQLVGARAILAGRGVLGEAEALRTQGASLDVFVTSGEKAPAGWRALDDLLREASPRFEAVATGAAEPALCFFASCASGDPRAVIHRHAWTWAQREVGSAWLDLRPTDLHWATAEAGGARAASAAIFAPWSLGAPVFLHDGRLRPRRWLALLEKLGVSTFCASPTELRSLIRADPARYDLSRLRHVTAWGEPLGAGDVLAGKETLGLTLHDGYGQTEATLLVANVKGLPVRPGSMGMPFPGHDVCVIDERGEEVPAGRSGEIALRGRPPTVFCGAGRSGVTLRTGDRARRDEQGYFWFEGRTDDLIIAAGRRIGPSEVERVLLTHADVREAAAIAWPNSRGDPGVKAFVVLRDGRRGSARLAREIRAHVRATSPSFRCPGTIEFVSELPRSEDGSIRRGALRRC